MSFGAVPDLRPVWRHLLIFHPPQRALPTNSVSLRANYSNTQLMHDLECRLVAVETKLALKLRCADSWGLRCNKVYSPKPDVQRQPNKAAYRAFEAVYSANALQVARANSSSGKNC